MFTRTFNLTKASELMNFIAPWNNKFNSFIFRGHSDENYELLPQSLRRHELDKIHSLLSTMKFGDEKPKDTAGELMDSEYTIIREFYKLSDSNGLHVPLSLELRRDLSQKHAFRALFFSDDFPNVEWLPEILWELAALTQHYGLPTRLLDWTYDPFIAAYFASRSVNFEIGSDRLCIWGLNKEKMGFSKFIYSDISPLHFITPHYAQNPNITAQKGLFTHFSETINYTSKDEPDRTPLDKKIKSIVKPSLYKNENHPIFIKITLPKTEALRLFKLLENSGYGTARLFPGYDGVARQFLEKI